EDLVGADGQHVAQAGRRQELVLDVRDEGVLGIAAEVEEAVAAAAELLTTGGGKHVEQRGAAVPAVDVKVGIAALIQTDAETISKGDAYGRGVDLTVEVGQRRVRVDPGAEEDRLDLRQGARVDVLDRVAHEADEVREVAIAGKRIS